LVYSTATERHIIHVRISTGYGEEDDKEKFNQIINPINLIFSLESAFADSSCQAPNPERRKITYRGNADAE